jgi:hypothetical protein
VLWEDWDSDSTSHVVGSRVSEDGGVQDNLLVSRMPGRQAHPACACNSPAANFLAIWEEHSPLEDSILLYAARVDYDGNVQDTFAVRVCTTASQQTEPTIASDDSNYVVLWRDDRSGQPAVYATRLTTSLECDSHAGARLAPSQQNQSNPSVWWPWQDGLFLACWAESDREGRSSVQIGWLTDNGFYPDGTITDSLNLMTPKCIDFYGNSTFIASAVSATSHGTPTICHWPEYFVAQNERTSSTAVRRFRVEPSIARDRCRVEWQTIRPCTPLLQVLNVNGQVTKEYRCGALSPGRHQANLNLAGLSPGAYFVRLAAAGIAQTQRFVIVR